MKTASARRRSARPAALRSSSFRTPQTQTRTASNGPNETSTGKGPPLSSSSSSSRPSRNAISKSHRDARKSPSSHQSSSLQSSRIPLNQRQEALRLRKSRSSKVSRSNGQSLEELRNGKVDLEGSDSIIGRTNLRSVVNMDNFFKLPLSYRAHLVRLLPDVDRVHDEKSGRLKPSSTALSNEFFTRALSDYQDRLRSGKLLPEFINKKRNEEEKDMAKVDPWKVKHFEPVWGIRAAEAEEIGASNSSDSSSAINTSTGAAAARAFNDSSSPSHPAGPLRKSARITNISTLLSAKSSRKPNISFQPSSLFLLPRPVDPIDKLANAVLKGSITQPNAEWLRSLVSLENETGGMTPQTPHYSREDTHQLGMESLFDKSVSPDDAQPHIVNCHIDHTIVTTHHESEDSDSDELELHPRGKGKHPRKRYRTPSPIIMILSDDELDEDDARIIRSLPNGTTLTVKRNSRSSIRGSNNGIQYVRDRALSDGDGNINYRRISKRSVKPEDPSTNQSDDLSNQHLYGIRLDGTDQTPHIDGINDEQSPSIMDHDMRSGESNIVCEPVLDDQHDLYDVIPIISESEGQCKKEAKNTKVKRTRKASNRKRKTKRGTSPSDDPQQSLSHNGAQNTSSSPSTEAIIGPLTTITPLMDAAHVDSNWSSSTKEESISRTSLVASSSNVDPDSSMSEFIEHNVSGSRPRAKSSSQRKSKPSTRKKNKPSSRPSSSSSSLPHTDATRSVTPVISSSGVLLANFTTALSTCSPTSVMTSSKNAVVSLVQLIPTVTTTATSITTKKSSDPPTKSTGGRESSNTHESSHNLTPIPALNFEYKLPAGTELKLIPVTQASPSKAPMSATISDSKPLANGTLDCLRDDEPASVSVTITKIPLVPDANTQSKIQADTNKHPVSLKNGPVSCTPRPLPTMARITGIHALNNLIEAAAAQPSAPLSVPNGNIDDSRRLKNVTGQLPPGITILPFPRKSMINGFSNSADGSNKAEAQSCFCDTKPMKCCQLCKSYSHSQCMSTATIFTQGTRIDNALICSSCVNVVHKSGPPPLPPAQHIPPILQHPPPPQQQPQHTSTNVSRPTGPTLVAQSHVNGMIFMNSPPSNLPSYAFHPPNGPIRFPVQQIQPVQFNQSSNHIQFNHHQSHHGGQVNLLVPQIPLSGNTVPQPREMVHEQHHQHPPPQCLPPVSTIMMGSGAPRIQHEILYESMSAAQINQNQPNILMMPPQQYMQQHPDNQQHHHHQQQQQQHLYGQHQPTR